MKKPWQIWTLFALSLCVVVSAMGWVSRNVVRLERENIEIQRQSAYEETVRLALWRMDSAISLLVIEESSRPFYDYNAFNLSEVVNPNALNRKDESELVPSSLLDPFFAARSRRNEDFGGSDARLPAQNTAVPERLKV